MGLNVGEKIKAGVDKIKANPELYKEIMDKQNAPEPVAPVEPADLPFYKRTIGMVAIGGGIAVLGIVIAYIVIKKK